MSPLRGWEDIRKGLVSPRLRRGLYDDARYAGFSKLAQSEALRPPVIVTPLIAGHRPAPAGRCLSENAGEGVAPSCSLLIIE